MKAEAKELYVFTKDHFENDLSRISKSCVAPLIAVRRVVKKAMTKYIEDYCSKGTQFEDVFSEEDFQEVSKKIVDELE